MNYITNGWAVKLLCTTGNRLDGTYKEHWRVFRFSGVYREDDTFRVFASKTEAEDFLDMVDNEKQT